MTDVGNIIVWDSRAHAEFDLRIYGARLEGYSVKQICRELGIAEQEVNDAITRASDRISPKTRELLVQLDSARLDEYSITLHPRAKAGDIEAVRAMLAIMERRAKLFGLDAPTKSDFLMRREAISEEPTTSTDRFVAALQALQDQRKAEQQFDAAFEEVAGNDAT